MLSKLSEEFYSSSVWRWGLVHIILYLIMIVLHSPGPGLERLAVRIYLVIENRTRYNILINTISPAGAGYHIKSNSFAFLFLASRQSSRTKRRITPPNTQRKTGMTTPQVLVFPAVYSGLYSVTKFKVLSLYRVSILYLSWSWKLSSFLLHLLENSVVGGERKILRSW